MEYEERIIIPNFIFEKKLSNLAFAIAVALYNFNAIADHNDDSMFSVIYLPKHVARLCRLSTDATRKHIGELSETDIIVKSTKTKRGYTRYYLKKYEQLAENYTTLSKAKYYAIEPELLQAYLTVCYCNKHNISISALDTKPVGLRKLVIKGYIAPRGDTYTMLKGEL